MPEEENKKMTKKEYYDLIKNVIEGTDVAEKDELIEFINKQVAQIEAKAEKAKARAAEKRIAGDALREKVKSILTNELQTADEITNQIEDEEEISRAKVIARLTQLVKNGEAEKADVKVDSRNVKAYKLAE